MTKNRKRAQNIRDISLVNSLPVRNVNVSQTIRLVLEVYPYDAPLTTSFYNSTNMEVARYSVFDNPKESSWAVYQGKIRAVSSSDMAPNPSVNTLYISYGGNYDVVIKNTGTHPFAFNGTLSILSGRYCR
jgi:hypothetical protein